MQTENTRHAHTRPPCNILGAFTSAYIPYDTPLQQRPDTSTAVRYTQETMWKAAAGHNVSDDDQSDDDWETDPDFVVRVHNARKTAYDFFCLRVLRCLSYLISSLRTKLLRKSRDGVQKLWRDQEVFPSSSV